MQICDLEHYQLDNLDCQSRIIGGTNPRAIALGSASAIGFGVLTVTKTLTLTQISAKRYQVNSTGSATALSIASPYKNTSGVLAFGRATVSSLSIAQT
jgi:hypothetical protein